MTSNDMDGQITFLLLLFDFVFLSLLLRVASATERAASTHRTATDAFLSSMIVADSASFYLMHTNVFRSAIRERDSMGTPQTFCYIQVQTDFMRSMPRSLTCNT